MTKEELRAYHRDWYHKNKTRIGPRKTISNKKFYDKTRAFIIKAKGKPCTDCGNSYPHYVMDFDHLRDKKFNISNQYWRGLEALKIEIAKCELVCANCHRIRTFTR